MSNVLPASSRYGMLPCLDTTCSNNMINQNYIRCFRLQFGYRVEGFISFISFCLPTIGRNYFAINSQVCGAKWGLKYRRKKLQDPLAGAAGVNPTDLILIGSNASLCCSLSLNWFSQWRTIKKLMNIVPWDERDIFLDSLSCELLVLLIYMYC